MAQPIMASSLTLPDITVGSLKQLNIDVCNRERVLRQRILTFESRYSGSLVDLDRKLNTLEIEEHPAWEDSIEWRNAVEQLNSTQLSEKIFKWLQNLLTQSIN